MRVETATNHRWTLVESGHGDQSQRTIDLPQKSLIVGRTSDADVTIKSAGVSKRHAKISFTDEMMVVEDLGSTNGTYLNGEAIECTTCMVGDILQFANAVYRVGRRGDSENDGTLEEGILPWAQTLLLFERLVNDREVEPKFQPIVDMETQSVIGYELLARSGLEGLENPGLMFGVAERLGQQAALSELMREEGMRAVREASGPRRHTFLNTHPCEVGTDRLAENLRSLREAYPDLPMTIEIHEAALTAPAMMQAFRSVLQDLQMQLSYDDFGAGQGRLVELTEVPPDVLKFDMALIRDIDSATSTRQNLVASLVRIAQDAGSKTLAEGVETCREHETCRQLGFELGQGFFYGRPESLHRTT